MQITVDCNDYTSILACARMLARRLAPALESDLPVLLGRRAPSGFARVADAAARGRLHLPGYARDMLPVVLAACDAAVEDGTSTGGDWVEVGYTDGGVDWAWHEHEVMTDAALSLLPIRRDLRRVLELLERIDDLIAAQRDVAEL